MRFQTYKLKLLKMSVIIVSLLQHPDSPTKFRDFFYEAQMTNEEKIVKSVLQYLVNHNDVGNHVNNSIVYISGGRSTSQYVASLETYARLDFPVKSVEAVRENGVIKNLNHFGKKGFLVTIRNISWESRDEVEVHTKVEWQSPQQAGVGAYGTSVTVGLFNGEWVAYKNSPDWL